MPRTAPCADVRTAILEAATDLMERYGYRKMTIDDIAQEAGIGKATIYGYFENKQDVALAVLDRYYAKIRDRWLEIVEEGDQPDRMVRRLLLERVLSAFDNCARYRQSQDDSFAALKSLVLPRRESYNEVLAEILARVIRQGAEQGLFSSVDHMETARALLVSMGGLMPLSLSPRDFTQRDEIQRQASQVIDLVLYGLIRTDAARK